jgi:hypothetical protein
MLIRSASGRRLLIANYSPKDSTERSALTADSCCLRPDDESIYQSLEFS